MRRKQITLWALGLWMCLSAFPHSPVQAAGDPKAIVFQARTVTTDTGAYQYRVFVPVHWNKDQKWPVILFLHGLGAGGADNMIQTNAGIRLLIAQGQDRFPCLVVCPQCRADAFWPQPDMEKMALAALDQAVREFHGDPQREYLTGLSMGGYGTWDMAQNFPKRWAAIAPCCGGIEAPPSVRAALRLGPPPGDPYFPAAKKIARLPVWVFHGEADSVVPVSESRQMVALLVSLKADVRYTEYPGVDHNSWNYAYKDPGLLPWLLSHKSHVH